MTTDVCDVQYMAENGLERLEERIDALMERLERVIARLDWVEAWMDIRDKPAET